jgi:hypothetical protein
MSDRNGDRSYRRTAPPPLSELQALIAAQGGLRAAARSLDMAESTLRGWLKGSGNTPRPNKAAEIERPVLVSSHEPVEDLLARRVEQHRRKREAHDAKKWMRFTVKQPGPFGLAFVGDPHIDDDGTNLERLLADLDLIENTPSLYGVGMGDWINAWVGKLQRLYAHQGTTESDAWRMMQWVVERPLWLLLILGNHDLWHDIANPVRWMETSAPVENWQADFEVADASGQASWRISAAHDFPGRSLYNKAHGPLRRALLTGAAADLYIAGDKHCWSLMQDEEEHSHRQFWVARVRGYKELDSYGTQLGFGSQKHGHSMVAVCDPADRSMLCFSNIEQGAQYLTLLRQERKERQERQARGIAR